jgi:hypothetical protein
MSWWGRDGSSIKTYNHLSELWEHAHVPASYIVKNLRYIQGLSPANHLCEGNLQYSPCCKIYSHLILNSGLLIDYLQARGIHWISDRRFSVRKTARLIKSSDVYVSGEDRVRVELLSSWNIYAANSLGDRTRLIYKITRQVIQDSVFGPLHA